MRAIVIPTENKIVIDGRWATVNCTDLASIHVIQWTGTDGTIEFEPLPNGVQPSNTIFDVTSPFMSVMQPKLDAAQAIIVAEDTAAVITVPKLKLIKLVELDNLYRAKAIADISFSVGGTPFTWDADVIAVLDLNGVLALYLAGSYTGSRNWYPKGQIAPVSLTQANFVALFRAIADRRNTLFAVKKTKQGEIVAKATLAELNAYDMSAGW